MFFHSIEGDRFTRNYLHFVVPDPRPCRDKLNVVGAILTECAQYSELRITVEINGTKVQPRLLNNNFGARKGFGEL